MESLRVFYENPRMTSVLLFSFQDFFTRLFPSSSEDAYDINVLFLRFLIFSAFITVVIGGAIIISVIRFRESKRPGEPKQIFGHTKLEIAWTIFPLAIVILFFVLTLQVMQKINKPIPNGRKADIVIIAKQWWWDMRYPGLRVITANELHVPVGKRLLMRVESSDVVHDWWVPDLGPKVDAIPGHPNYIWLKAEKTGTFSGACSEYCGTQHAWMRISVIVESQSEFDKWVESQQKTPHAPSDSLAKAGASLFEKKTCMNCHSVSADPTDAHVGPNLSHLGSRSTLLSGKVVNTKENLSAWLQNPQQLKEGALMPNFLLKKEDVKALTAYLEELK